MTSHIGTCNPVSAVRPVANVRDPSKTSKPKSDERRLTSSELKRPMERSHPVDDEVCNTHTIHVFRA